MAIGPATTSEEELLCRGQSHGADSLLAGLWYLLSLPLRPYVCHCRGGWVVLLHGQKLATRCGHSGATWHELQSDLQIAVSSPGLSGAQVRPSCEPRPVTTSVNVGLLSKRYIAHPGQMLLV